MPIWEQSAILADVIGNFCDLARDWATIGIKIALQLITLGHH